MTFARTFLLLTAISFTSGLFAQSTTTVAWENDNTTLLRNAAGLPLSQGVATVNQDGRLVQLGYFTSGTVVSNFAGAWIPLTLTTKIGDSLSLSGAGDGAIQFSTTFKDGSSSVDVYDSSDPGFYTTTSSVSISSTTPPAGQVLGIRFYDSTDASGMYNTASSDTWLWQTPTLAGSFVVIQLQNSVLEWEGGQASAFRTTIPEPTTLTLLVGGLLPFLRRRRCV